MEGQRRVSWYALIACKSARFTVVCLAQEAGISNECYFYRCRKNVILSNVVEERTVDSSMYDTAKTPSQVITVKRRLSQAMIPGPHLVKVEVTKAVYDAAMCKVSPVIDALQ